MNTRKIYTENPVIEQWRLLSQYTYFDNITVFQLDANISCTDDVKEYISGCLNQGRSYFNIATKASLDIKPPLVYYGAINLLAGTYALLTGNKPPIKTHGIEVLEDSIKFPLPDSNISESSIRLKSPNDGAVLIFHSSFSNTIRMDLNSGSEWTIKELLSSIPDLCYDFRNYFPASKLHIIPLQRIQTKVGIIERIEKKFFNSEDQIIKDLESVINFKKEYLNPQVTRNYIILRKKISSSNDLGVFSLSGAKYLQLPHLKNGNPNNTSQVIYMLMCLFFLGYISRYKPEVWNVFIRKDATGEKYMFEKMLDIAIRYFPNLVLNTILGSKIQFSNDLDSIGNLDEGSTK